MPYLGNTPTSQTFISGTDYFNGTGSQTAFTLSRTITSANDIQATVNNVVQQPNDAYTVSGTTITFTSAPSAGTNNVYVRYLSTTTQAITPSQGTVGYSTLDSNMQSAISTAMKNRIINGAMVIDQRNAGASTTPASNAYTLDRWQTNTAGGSYTVQQNAGSVTPPVGFKNYYGATSTGTTAANTFAIRQAIEGYNIADLGWGTANAKTVTLSFWVQSSLTGLFSGSFLNNNFDRAYVFTYTITTANTWQYVTATITGDTTGTWESTSSAGIWLWFAMGVSTVKTAPSNNAWLAGDYRGASGTTNVMGTNGATFYITGVQLEVGSSATGFEYVNYQTSLANCQRYFSMSFSQGTAPAQNAGTTGAITGQGQAASAPAYAYAPFKVTMRASPTITTFNTSAANANWRNTTAGSDLNVAVSNAGDSGTFIGSNTQVLAQYAICAIHYTASAEL